MAPLQSLMLSQFKTELDDQIDLMVPENYNASWNRIDAHGIYNYVKKTAHWAGIATLNQFKVRYGLMCLFCNDVIKAHSYTHSCKNHPRSVKIVHMGKVVQSTKMSRFFLGASHVGGLGQNQLPFLERKRDKFFVMQIYQKWPMW